MIKYVVKGDFGKTESFLNKLKQIRFSSRMDKYGKAGVRALASATPRDTGKTADSWDYEIEEEPGRTTITWFNSNVQNGVNIALILQYGHGTRTGGYVQGRDYINPALQSVFDEMADAAWKEVTSL